MRKYWKRMENGMRWKNRKEKGQNIEKVKGAGGNEAPSLSGVRGRGRENRSEKDEKIQGWQEDMIEGIWGKRRANKEG